MLVEKLRDQLPAGSARNYAAMLVLNHLECYSKKGGLQMEERGRLAVVSLPLEFLYMAWYNDVGIELSERQLESWPSHVWKNSANLGVNLYSLVTQPNSRLIHDRLRDVRTLLSFGAVVNRYHELIQLQHGGLSALMKTYQHTEPHNWDPPLISPSPASTQPMLSRIYAKGPSGEADSSAWSWLPWRANKSSEEQHLERFGVLGSTPLPPVEAFPLHIPESTPQFHSIPRQEASIDLSSSGLSCCDSGTISSSGTNESIATTQISALERLEAYLSVLGTPQCEPIIPKPIRKPRLPSLEEAEETAQVQTLQEPVRKPIQFSLQPLTMIIQKKLPELANSDKLCPLRWMTGEELKCQCVAQNPVGYRLQVLKGNKRLAYLKSNLPKIATSYATRSQMIILVDEGDFGDRS
ncbi:hypothetical protein RhiXN_04963 [Rhizoctonia solani]|uniref:Uncharacterized protein n=1 Tax=Rhizoctonia solani TaxID=456999 RepID=A0A8H8SSM7_9AGAM|nr:uncharacterized protein RhiXN_04963 [Rhizoctonia solani]QRW16961.1 hypothetical protein RhiXN_04963 [Rhizoctonia solani]